MFHPAGQGMSTKTTSKTVGAIWKLMAYSFLRPLEEGLAIKTVAVNLVEKLPHGQEGAGATSAWPKRWARAVPLAARHFREPTWDNLGSGSSSRRGHVHMLENVMRCSHPLQRVYWGPQRSTSGCKNRLNCACDLIWFGWKRWFLR